MPRFCYHCGSALEDAMQFCPRCGTKQIAVEATSFCTKCGAALQQEAEFCMVCGTPKTAQPAPPAAPSAQPVTQQAAPAPAPERAFAVSPAAGETPVQQPQRPIPPTEAPLTDQTAAGTGEAAEKPVRKKGRKKWIITGVGAGALALAAVIFFVFIMPLFAKAANPDRNLVVFKNGRDAYYASPCCINLDGDPEPVMVKDFVGNERNFHYADAVQVGDVFYYCKRLNGYDNPYTDFFVKAKFTSKNTMEESTWLVPPVLDTVDFGSESDISPNLWIMFIRNLTSDGKSVFFNLIPDQEYFATHMDAAGKVGRISLDGKRVESFGDINAVDLIADGSWIYYFDVGYDSDGKTIDASRTGIYKIRTNGTGKKLLRPMTLTDSQKSSSVSDLFTTRPCGEMKLIDNKLCFVDYTEGGQGRLCRMDKNGKNFEYLTTNAVRHYTIDTERDVAYYLAGKPDDKGIPVQHSNTPELFKCELRSQAETKIPFVGKDMDDLSCYGGNLYFFNEYAFYTRWGSDSDAHSGLRMDIATEKFQWLIIYKESSHFWTTDPDTGKPVHVIDEKDPITYWEDAETQ